MCPSASGPAFRAVDFLTVTGHVVQNALTLLRWYNCTRGGQEERIDAVRWCTIGGGSQLPAGLSSKDVHQHILSFLRSAQDCLCHLVPHEEGHINVAHTPRWSTLTLMTARISSSLLPRDAPSSLAPLLAKSPVRLRSHVMECYLQVYRQLVALDWPVSYGRTNVTPLGAESSGLHTMSVGLLVHFPPTSRASSAWPKTSTGYCNYSKIALSSRRCHGQRCS